MPVHELSPAVEVFILAGVSAMDLIEAGSSVCPACDRPGRKGLLRAGPNSFVPVIGCAWCRALYRPESMVAFYATGHGLTMAELASKEKRKR